MIDYEQLYYDSQYKIKQLQKRIDELETEMRLRSKRKVNTLAIRKEIIKEISSYHKKRKGIDKYDNNKNS